MQDNPSPSALAIRRATRVRELTKMKRTDLLTVMSMREREHPRVAVYVGAWTKEGLINEILHLEGLDMAVLA